MKELDSVIKLSDKKEYVVLKIRSYENNTYLLLMDLIDNSVLKVVEYKEKDNKVIIVKDENLLTNLQKIFI